MLRDGGMLARGGVRLDPVPGADGADQLVLVGQRREERLVILLGQPARIRVRRGRRRPGRARSDSHHIEYNSENYASWQE